MPAHTKAARLASIPGLPSAAPSTVWRGFVARLLAAQHALATRQALLEMDGRMLKDIGITHADAVAEARRMPWDLGPRGRR